MRRTANKKQCKFLNYVLTPIRILKMARELYMKGVQDCAGGLAYGGRVEGFTFPISHLPAQSFNFKYLRTNGGGDNEKLLIRKVQIRNMNAENDRRLIVQGQKQPNARYNGMRKSYSVELRKMERIDEDKPSCFEEDQIDSKTHVVASKKQELR